jgi:type I restriction enzyme S subunit
VKLPVYPKYKPSGTDWVGAVPAQWEVKRLKFLLLKNDGGVWGEEDDPDGTVVLRSTEQTLSGGWRIEDPAKRALTPKEQTACRLERGDLVVTKSSGSELHIGKTSLVNSKVAALRACFSNFMQRLRVSTSLDPRIGFYLLNSPTGRQQSVVNSNTTTGLANLNGTVLGDIICAVPPGDEQRAIADFLDRETARLDTLVGKKRELIEKLKEKRTALISRTVTRGLPPDAAGLNSRHKLKPSGIEWLGDIPERWKVMKVKFVARMESGHTPSRSESSNWIEEECLIPWVSLNDTKFLRDNDFIGDTAVKISEEGMRNSSAHLLPAGVVVFTRDATIGLTAITTCPAAVSQHIIAWVPGSKITPKFLMLSFKAMQQYLESLTFGSTLKTIGMTDVRKLVTPIPAVAEQIAIADYLDRETAKLDRMMEKVEAAIEKLQEYRTALITAAVTGKIDVRNVAK